MALSADQLKVIRSWVGEGPSDSDLNERYLRLETLTETVGETLRYELAVLIDQPSDITLPSGLSIRRSANITALQEQLKRFLAFGSLDDENSLGGEVLKLHRKQYR